MLITAKSVLRRLAAKLYVEMDAEQQLVGLVSGRVNFNLKRLTAREESLDVFEVNCCRD